jgi:transcription elongation GreA/GreB family factor
MPIDKSAVFADVLAALRADLADIERIHAMAIDEATGSESKAENQYDTRSLEASYLAAGQGERVAALRRLVALFDAYRPHASTRVGMFALVEIRDSAGSSWVLVAPDGGGRRVIAGDRTILLVTPDSPLGAALMGASEGDTLALRAREIEVEQVV